MPDGWLKELLLHAFRKALKTDWTLVAIHSSPEVHALLVLAPLQSGSYIVCLLQCFCTHFHLWCELFKGTSPVEQRSTHAILTATSQLMWLPLESQSTLIIIMSIIMGPFMSVLTQSKQVFIRCFLCLFSSCVSHRHTSSDSLNIVFAFNVWLE